MSKGKKKIKRGVALEGGGARGAYHMGAVKAYLEAGYEFDGFVGTSIGAINGVMLASGQFEKCLEIWENLVLTDLFDDEFIDFLNQDAEFPKSVTTALRKLISDRGIDHTKMRDFLNTYIDEDYVRQNSKDFGLVTYSITERKAYEVFLEDIPNGKLVDYILASAKLPFFAPHQIDSNRFLDGGIVNSCPINMLVDKGYDEIIAIRTNSFGMFRRYDKNANVTIIEAKETLGHFLSFDGDSARANIKRGYCDAARVIHNLKGRHYYLKAFEATLMTEKLFNLTQADLDSLPFFRGSLADKRRELFEVAIPETAATMGLDKDFTYDEYMLGLVEFIAEEKEIDVYEVYDGAVFCKLVKETKMPERDSFLNRVGLDPAARRIEFLSELLNLLID